MTEETEKGKIAQALRTALEYEHKVKDVYTEAEAQAEAAVGKKVFGVLAKEEQGHIDYLEHMLDRFECTGCLDTEGLETMIPEKETIDAGVKKLKERLDGAKASAAEVDLLRKALKVEEETSDFYKKVVSELPAEGQAFFQPFVAIEDGHVAIVQAEIDAATGVGFWFDFQEFNLEAG